MRQKIIQSIPKKSSRLLMLLGGILLTAFSIYFLSSSILTNEKDSFYLIISCFLFSVGMTCFYYAIPYDIIEVYNDSIEITSFWRKKKIIIRKEIIKLNSSYPSPVAHKVIIGTMVFSITTEKFIYRINESHYKNFFALHKEIRKGKIPLATESEYFGSSQSKQDTFIIIVGALFFLSIILYQQLSK
jgi:hypothetical protein